MTKRDIVEDIVYRKLNFHLEEEDYELKGLFSWNKVFPYLVSNPNAKEKLLITDYTKENKTIWAKPTEEFKKELEEIIEKRKNVYFEMKGYYNEQK